jgi:putative SOS response-associated peptidase YedK
MGTSKQPHCFEVNDGELFAFAGLWDGWKNQVESATAEHADWQWPI